MDLNDLQLRTSGLILPYASATTIYTALYLNYGVTPVLNSQLKAAEAWDEIHHTVATEKARELSRKYMIDADLAVSEARKIFMYRSRILSSPSTFLGQVMGYLSDDKIYRRNFNDESLPELQLLQSFYFIGEWLRKQQTLSFHTSNGVQRDKLVSAAYEDFVDHHPDLVSMYGGPVLNFMREVVTDLFEVFAIMSDVSKIDKPSFYSALAMKEMLSSLYDDSEMVCLIVARFYNKDFFGYDDKEKLDSPLDMAMESLHGQIELTDIESTIASIDHMTAAMKNRFTSLVGEKGLANRAVMVQLKSEYPESLADFDTDVMTMEFNEDNHAIAMEGVISGTTKLIRKVIIRIFKMIRDAINGVLKIIGKPFGVRLRFTVDDESEPEASLQEWGKAFNSALDDYLEQNPILESRIQPHVQFIRALLSAADDVVSVTEDTNAKMRKAMSSKDDRDFNNAINGFGERYKSMAYAINIAPIESGIFPNLVEYIEPKPDDGTVRKMIDQPLSKYMREVRQAVGELEKSKVQQRMTSLNNIKGALNMADEKYLEEIVERNEDDIKDIDKHAKRMRDGIELVSDQEAKKFEVMGMGVEMNMVDVYNRLQREYAELMMTIANAATTSNQLFYKLAKRTAEMRLQADAIFK